MTRTKVAASSVSKRSDRVASLLRYNGSCPVHLAGSDNGLYERHLVFDNVVRPAAADSRERFAAFARSVRDLLSQRWVQTEETYDRENPKRVHYLSMEFLIGRSLANNVMNLLLDPIVQQAAVQKELNWIDLL